MRDSYALVADGRGSSVLHAVDCPEVDRAADDGVPVMRMYECRNTPPLPPAIAWHDCLPPVTHDHAVGER